MPTLKQKFTESSDVGLQYCLDRFMMNVLKVFLQSVDEGLADIIDELEDSCTADVSAGDQLKSAIIKFQQQSFQKREKLSRDHFESKQEMNKNSFEWFDNFFGDVTTLLKNPLSIISSSKSPSKSQAGFSPPSQKESQREAGEWINQDVVCRLPLVHEIQGSSSKNNRKPSKDDDGESSFDDLPAMPAQICKSEKGDSNGLSNETSWRRPKSHFDIGSNWSNTQAPSSGSKLRRPLDLQKADLEFEDVFTLENFSVDGSSRRILRSRVLCFHRESQQHFGRHRQPKTVPIQHYHKAKRGHLR